LPLLPFLPLPSRSGGNIAEIVYHVANGSVLIIAVRVKRSKREKGGKPDGKVGVARLIWARNRLAEDAMKAHRLALAIYS